MSDDGRVLFQAPTLDGDSGWLDIGHLSSEGLPFEYAPGTDPRGDQPDHDARMLGALSSSFGSVAMRLDADLSPGMLAFVGVDQAADGRAAVTFVQHVEPLVAPRKRRRLTGKAYRQARRRYARERRAWVRAGRPLVPVVTYLPSVTFGPPVPVPGKPGTFSIGGTLAPAPADDAWWAGPAD